MHVCVHAHAHTQNFVCRPVFKQVFLAQESAGNMKEEQLRSRVRELEDQVSSQMIR